MALINNNSSASTWKCIIKSLGLMGECRRQQRWWVDIYDVLDLTWMLSRSKEQYFLFHLVSFSNHRQLALKY